VVVGHLWRVARPSSARASRRQVPQGLKPGSKQGSKRSAGSAAPPKPRVFRRGLKLISIEIVAAPFDFPFDLAQGFGKQVCWLSLKWRSDALR
jgi:hypothetical protein